GGGASEQGTARVGRPGPRVAQRVKEARLFVVVVGTEGAVFGAGVLVPPVGDAGLPHRSEGDGVAAGFGEKVAAEAEHVRPPAQADIGRGGAQDPACVGEPFGGGAGCLGIQGGGVGGGTGPG